MSTGEWIFSVLWMVIILAILAAAIFWLVSAARDGRAGTPSVEAASAREILDRRLASGELTLEHYHQMRAAIGESGQPTETRPTGAVD